MLKYVLIANVRKVIQQGNGENYIMRSNHFYSQCVIVRIMILRMRWPGHVPWIMEGKNIKFVFKGPYERFRCKAHIIIKLLLNIL
jgi:hypothetical protein